MTVIDLCLMIVIDLLLTLDDSDGSSFKVLMTVMDLHLTLDDSDGFSLNP